MYRFQMKNHMYVYIYIYIPCRKKNPKTVFECSSTFQIFLLANCKFSSQCINAMKLAILKLSFHIPVNSFLNYSIEDLTKYVIHC